MKEPVYCLHLTEKQLKTLNKVCDAYSRLICGQDHEFQELMERAWEKRCLKATGYAKNKNWEGGWYKMREDAEEICRKIKERFWGLPWTTINGIYYDEEADMLYDLHQVIRHQLWLDRPDDEKSTITVDADKPMHISSEPLATITKVN